MLQPFPLCYIWADGDPEGLRDQPRGPHTFSVKSQIGTDLSFAGHSAPVTRFLLFCFDELTINEKSFSAHSLYKNRLWAKFGPWAELADCPWAGPRHSAGEGHGRQCVAQAACPPSSTRATSQAVTLMDAGCHPLTLPEDSSLLTL